MKLLDVNILLYATRQHDPLHPKVAVWFDALMNSGERIALPWHTLLGARPTSISASSRG